MNNLITLIKVLLLSWISISAYAQVESSPSYPFNEDLIKLEKRIRKQVKKESCIRNVGEINISYAFMFMGYNGDFIKEDFLNLTFLRNIVPSYYERKICFFWKVKQPKIQAYISDSLGNLIGISDGHILHSACRYKTIYSCNR